MTNLPAKPQTAISLIPEVSPEFKEAVGQAVAMMFDTLNTYGKKATGDLLDAWILKLTQREVRIDEIGAALGHFLDGQDFPKPGEFCDWILERRQQRDMTESLRAGVAAADRLADERHRAWLKETFGDENPELEVVRDHLRSKFGSEELPFQQSVKRIGFARTNAIDQTKLRAIEQELKERAS